MRFRFQSPFIMRTGYGKLGCWLGEEFLRRRDSQVEIAVHQDKLYDDVPQSIREAAAKPADYRDLGLLLSYADHLNFLPTLRKSIYTMWETTRLPTPFVRALSGKADVVFVPSTFCLSLFQSELEDTRVENVGCGVDTSFYTYDGPRHRGKLLIGTSGVMSPRKGIDVLLRAFEAADIGDEAKLLVKTRDTRWLPSRIPPDVIVYDAEWNEERLREFYRRLDYFILPSRGEGFGLPPIEAACCGTPGYVTNWSGPRDYVGRYIKPINWTQLNAPPKDVFRFGHVGQWAEPSCHHLVHIFRDMYNTGRPTEEERRNVSRWARGNYDIRQVADRLHAGLRGITRGR